MAYVKKNKPRNFLNNPDLMEQIRLSKAEGKMSDTLAKMCVTLVDKYAMHPNYANIYYNKEDMIAHAYFTLFKSWHYFNPDKSNNPFAYYTQITKHAFYEYLRKEKQQMDIRGALALDLGVNPDEFADDSYNEDAALSMEARPTEEPASPDLTGSSHEV